MDQHRIAPIIVQPQVRAYAESLGAFGHLWLDALPGTVERQCQEWGLHRSEALAGGSRSYVCRVTTADDQPAVLKLALPEPLLETQIVTLVAAQGCGYVQVLAHDTQRGALLLEALGPSAEQSLHDVPVVLSLTAAALKQAWQVPLEFYPPLRDESEHKAAGLFALVQGLAADRTDQRLQGVVDQALHYARQRLKARDPARQVVVHGDAHAGNLLRVTRVRRGAEMGYVLIDPEGFRCEPEYDLGVALRGWNTQLLATSDPQSELRSWCAQLAHSTKTDAEAIWQWAYLERVSTALYLAHHGMPELGRPFFAVAHRLLG
jgi:streptomycin 6-kinase